MQNMLICKHPFRERGIYDLPGSFLLLHFKSNAVIAEVANINRKQDAAFLITMLPEIKFSQHAIGFNQTGELDIFSEQHGYNFFLIGTCYTLHAAIIVLLFSKRNESYTIYICIAIRSLLVIHF